MGQFKYRAMTSSGNKIDGNYFAKDKSEVISMITSNGYYPLMVEEVKESTKIEFSLFERVRVKDISIFCRQLYTMLDAGVSLNRGLNIMANQFVNKKLKKIIGELEEGVKKGEMLSIAMKKHSDVFPQLLLSMVESGEVSGNLDIMLLRMSNHYEKENKLNNKIKAASIYPIILALVAIIAVGFIMVYVVPTFMKMFEQQEVKLPFITKALLSTSGFMSKNIILIVLAIAVAVVGFNYYKRTETGIYAISKLKLNLPIIGNLTRKIIVSRFTRTTATLLSSGVSLIQTIPVVAGVVGNKVAEEALLKVKEDVMKGEGLSQPIRAAGIFPEMLSSMISIGEETGALDDILNKTSDFYDEEVEQAIAKATAMIEPLLIAVMGLVIGGIVIAIMLPMFDMYSQI